MDIPLLDFYIFKLIHFSLKLEREPRKKVKRRK